MERIEKDSDLSSDSDSDAEAIEFGGSEEDDEDNFQSAYSNNPLF